MGKKNLQFILVSLFLISGTLNIYAQNRRLGGGSGTANDPYRIKTAVQLDSIVLATADGYSYNTPGLYFQIDNDILVSSSTFVSINGFNGNINGQNYTIKLSTTSPAFKGLFDNVTGATIENVVISLSGFSSATGGGAGPLIGTVSNSTIKNCRAVGPAGYAAGNNVDVGGLVGIVKNTYIENCFSEVQLNAFGSGSRIGGLIGTIANSSGMATTIKNCYVTAAFGNCTGTDVGGLIGKIVNTPGGSNVIIENCSAIEPGLLLKARSNVGGLIGSVEQPTTIKNSYSNIEVRIDGGNQAGGLIGNITSPVSIDNCYALGAVTVGTTQSNVGALIGFVNANSTITNSYSSSPVTCLAGGSNVGGLIGQVGNSVVDISYCYANGSITLTNACQYVGGLIGQYNGTGTIDQTYASGSVAGAAGHQYVGGLIGQMGSGTLKNSFASGSVSTNYVGSAYVGGLVGLSDGTIDNCFAANTSNVTGATGSDYLGGLVGYVRGAGTLRNSNAGMSTVGMSGTTATNIYEICGKVDNSANISNNKAFAGMTVNTLGAVTLHDANNERGASYSPQMNIAIERQQYFDLGWSDDVWSFNGNPKIPQTSAEKAAGTFSTPQLFSTLTLRLTPQVFVGGLSRACYGNPSTTTSTSFPVTGSNFEKFDYRIISEDGTVAEAGTDIDFIEDIFGSMDLSANNALQSFTYYPSSSSPTDPNLRKPVLFTVEITPKITVNGYSPSIAPVIFPFAVVNPAPMGFVLPATTVAYYDGATPLPDHEVKVKMIGGAAPWVFSLTTYDNSFPSLSSVITGGSYNDSIVTVLVPTPTAGASATNTNYYRYYLEKTNIHDISGCASTVTFAVDQDTPGVVDTLYVRGAATVTFDSQGGTPVASQTLTNESKATVPTPPTKSGLAFSGWYREAACINAWNFASDLVIQDTMLYARWLSVYTIIATSDANSSISPSGTMDVVSGSSQIFTFTPASGYGIDQVLIDGVNDPAAASSGNYTFTNVTASHTISVKTVVTPFQIKVQPVGGTVCLGGTYTFEVLVGGNVTYQWYKGNNAIMGATGNTYQVTNATRADYENYSVLIKNQNMSIRSNEATLWVAEPLPTNLVFAQFPKNAVTGTQYTISLDGYTDVTKYTWSYSGMGATFTPESGTKNETQVRFNTPGTGTVRVDMEHVCGPRTASQAINVKYPTGIDPVAVSELKIYPNPVENILTVQGTQAKKQAIRIVNTTGQLVYSGDAKDETTTIDFSGYAKGTYLLNCNGKTIKVMKK